MGDFGQVRDKWVCPNDRELSLRAKLKTGWSVKTSSINSFAKPEQLNDKEQEAIMNVIKRAENLEKVEQERVGRLVERLDNMKKNAMGNGTTQCVLCADEFGILGASPLLCNDCKKAVCTKCGVDTLSAHKEPLWLCKICSETRETWKKSGAWFYKGLPKYILPGRKNEQAKYGRGVAQSSEHNTGSPVRSYNAWLQSKAGGGGRSSSDKEYTDSSDDELRSAKLSRKQTRRRYLSESVENNDNPSTYPGNQQQVPKMNQGASFSQYANPESAYSVAQESGSDTVPVGAAPPSVYPRAAEAYLPISPGKRNPEASASTYWYKPRREVAEDEVVEKRHVRQESISCAAGIGESRVPEPKPNERRATKETFEEATSPEGASKSYRKRILKKLKRK